MTDELGGGMGKPLASVEIEGQIDICQVCRRDSNGYIQTSCWRCEYTEMIGFEKQVLQVV